MIKTRQNMITLILALFVTITSGVTFAADDAKEPRKMYWSFDGPFGKFDRQSAQRGLQVYKEVCAACHSLKLVPYRALEKLGYSEAQVKAFASQYTVTDGPNDEGEMYERPAIPADRFVSPYKNENQARAANNGAYPVDLSLIVKARVGGANYLYSLLTGYREAPEDFNLSEGMYYNPYFPGKQIAMPPPLSADLVNYTDGTNATISQMAIDLANFLQWAAEPETEDRHKVGLKVLLYLAIFTILFYIAKVRIWARLQDE